MNIEKLMQGVSAGDRRALAQAITLVESSRADHRVMATALLTGCDHCSDRRCASACQAHPGLGNPRLLKRLAAC